MALIKQNSKWGVTAGWAPSELDLQYTPNRNYSDGNFKFVYPNWKITVVGK